MEVVTDPCGSLSSMKDRANYMRGIEDYSALTGLSVFSKEIRWIYEEDPSAKPQAHWVVPVYWRRVFQESEASQQHSIKTLQSSDRLSNDTKWLKKNMSENTNHALFYTVFRM